MPGRCLVKSNRTYIQTVLINIQFLDRTCVTRATTVNDANLYLLPLDSRGVNGGNERGPKRGTSPRSGFAYVREWERRPLRAAEYLRNGSEKNVHRRAGEVKERTRADTAREKREKRRGARNQKRDSERDSMREGRQGREGRRKPRRRGVRASPLNFTRNFSPSIIHFSPSLFFLRYLQSFILYLSLVPFRSYLPVCFPISFSNLVVYLSLSLSLTAV